LNVHQQPVKTEADLAKHESREPSIIVPESKPRSWPADVSFRSSYGCPRPNALLFNISLKIVRAFRQDYHWIALHPTNNGELTNSISTLPGLLDILEDIFRDELGSDFSPEQLQLLIQSEIVIIAVCKETGDISGYCSGRQLPASMQTFTLPIVFGCHEVISIDHQQSKLGVFMASLLFVYGQKITNLFSPMGIVVRSNNRHILRPLQQAGQIFRSDKLSITDPKLQEERAVISYMHDEVFGLKDVSLEFGTPLEVAHYFEERVRIEGLSGNQIIYILCKTTLARAVAKLVYRRRRKTKNG
jgi:hypothetical protein